MSFSAIGPGDTVVFATPHGTARGRVVMRSSHGGWVVNLGGKYGTPGIVDESNFMRIARTARRSESEAIKRLGLHRNPRSGYWTDEVKYPRWSVMGRPFGSHRDAREFAESRARGGRPVVVMQQDDEHSPAFHLEDVRLRDVPRRYRNYPYSGADQEVSSMQSFENPELLVVDNPRRRRRRKARNGAMKARWKKRVLGRAEYIRIVSKSLRKRRKRPLKYFASLKRASRMFKKARKVHGGCPRTMKSFVASLASRRKRKKAANSRRRRSGRRRR